MSTTEVVPERRSSFWRKPKFLALFGLTLHLGCAVGMYLLLLRSALSSESYLIAILPLAIVSIFDSLNVGRYALLRKIGLADHLSPDKTPPGILALIDKATVRMKSTPPIVWWKRLDPPSGSYFAPRLLGRDMLVIGVDFLTKTDPALVELRIASSLVLAARPYRWIDRLGFPSTVLALVSLTFFLILGIDAHLSSVYEVVGWFTTWIIGVSLLQRVATLAMNSALRIFDTGEATSIAEELLGEKRLAQIQVILRGPAPEPTTTREQAMQAPVMTAILNGPAKEMKRPEIQ